MSFGESGNYSPGAEFDPRAPWNEKSPPMWECRYCGEEFEDKHLKYEALDGDEVCTGCLAGALDVALIEVGKLRTENADIRNHIGGLAAMFPRAR